MNGEDPMDRYYAGCLVFVVLSRSRWSDISRLDRLDFDLREVNGRLFGFVESSTRIQKTATTAEKKTLSMPLVAPVQGAGEGIWAVTWRDDMKEIGFPLDRSSLETRASRAGPLPRQKLGPYSTRTWGSLPTARHG